MKHSPSEDINFDLLAAKFQKKVYGRLKGKIRLAVLERDLSDAIPDLFTASNRNGLEILDAGSGSGPFSLNLAGYGHSVTLCDISEQMLASARAFIEEHRLEANTQIVHSSIQDLSADHDAAYDLILCHAVLEWVNDPQKIIGKLSQCLKPAGILSITFYNIHGLIYKNLLRSNYKKIIKQDFQGWPGSLTPPNPLDPQIVLTWFETHLLTLLHHSGIRVFHDYVLDLEDQSRQPEIALMMELEFSTRQPYRDLGRYQHLVYQKANTI